MLYIKLTSNLHFVINTTFYLYKLFKVVEQITIISFLILRGINYLKSSIDNHILKCGIHISETNSNY